MSTLDVSEIFGPTVQGEGSAAGRHCVFLRLAHCNLECTWCDTPYTWAFTPSKVVKLEKPPGDPARGRRLALLPFNKSEQIRTMTSQEVITELLGIWDFPNQNSILVVSGGEPMMQQSHLHDVLRTVVTWGSEVHIETAGTLMPTWEFANLVTQFNVSPKLEHSGNPLKKRYRSDVLDFFARTDKAWFKFVVRNIYDFEEIDQMVAQHNIPATRVMIMPEGVTIEDNLKVARAVVDETTNRGYGLSLRTHILLWKDVRGR